MRYVCKNCGLDVTPEAVDYDVSGYNEIENGWETHTITLVDDDGFPMPAPCGPVERMTDGEYVQRFAGNQLQHPAKAEEEK